MACNGSPINGFRNPTQKITMTAGQSYTGAWLHTLTSKRPHSQEHPMHPLKYHKALGQIQVPTTKLSPQVTRYINLTLLDQPRSNCDPQGPVMAYMKKVSDSLSGNPSSGPGGGWFKISEDAYSNGMSQKRVPIPNLHLLMTPK